MNHPDPTPEQPAGRNRDEILTDAIRVLTEAGRSTWSRVDDTGRTLTSPCDWAEFVTAALAGAAANLGGIASALAGRPGSWEADGVRTLLTGTVGDDEQYLLEHRTEPVEITLYVEEIMMDLGVWRSYDDAQAELVRRYEAIGIPSASSPEAVQQLEPATDEQERQAEAVGELEDRLEQQRIADWADYGQALQTTIETAARRREGLRVPVIVRIDLDTFPSPGGQPYDELAGALQAEAIEATPLPGGGRTPLDRLMTGQTP